MSGKELTCTVCHVPCEKKCSRCPTYYCSTAHQKLDWEKHRKTTIHLDGTSVRDQQILMDFQTVYPSTIVRAKAEALLKPDFHMATSVDTMISARRNAVEYRDSAFTFPTCTELAKVILSNMYE